MPTAIVASTERASKIASIFKRVMKIGEANAMIIVKAMMTSSKTNSRNDASRLKVANNPLSVEFVVILPVLVSCSVM